MPLRILASNVIDAATSASVTLGTALSGYPAANVLTARRSEVARATTAFVSGSNYFANFTVPLPATVPVNCVVLARTNVAANGLFAAYLRNAGSVVANTGNTAPITGDPSLDTLNAATARGINNHVFWLGSTYSTDEVTGQLATVFASGTVEMARIMAGVYKELALNFDWGNTVEWVDPGSSLATYGGDLIASYNGPPRRKITLPFSGIPEADRAYLYDLMRAVGTSGELFISLWPGAGGRLERDHQMWCRIANTDALRQSHVDFYGASITFIEC